MTRDVVYPVTDVPPGQRVRRDWRAVARGVWAVIVLCASAVDHLVAALTGKRTAAWCTRRIGNALAETYRRARGAPATPEPVPAVIDGAIITDDEQEGA